jgi:hypothetical protein
VFRLRLWEKCPTAHGSSVAGRRADGSPPAPYRSHLQRGFQALEVVPGRREVAAATVEYQVEEERAGSGVERPDEVVLLAEGDQ